MIDGLAALGLRHGIHRIALTVDQAEEDVIGLGRVRLIAPAELALDHPVAALVGHEGVAECGVGRRIAKGIAAFPNDVAITAGCGALVGGFLCGLEDPAAGACAVSIFSLEDHRTVLGDEHLLGLCRRLGRRNRSGRRIGQVDRLGHRPDSHLVRHARVGAVGDDSRRDRNG